MTFEYTNHSSLDLPMQGLVSLLNNHIFKSFSFREEFLHEVVDPFGLSGKVVPVVSCNLISCLDLLPGNTSHFLVISTGVVDDLAVPVT